MSDLMFSTEKEVKDILITAVKLTDEAPVVFVAFREQSSNSFNRTVTFVIQTKEGNEALINNIIKSSMNYEKQFKFVKSDLNMQDGKYTVDYVMIEATIYPKLV
tara:strand:- start:100 stop:411 length:312 start_codon:yes stop_codon:yes gene_type:complete